MAKKTKPAKKDLGTKKVDLFEVSIAQICQLTGKGFRTVKKKLQGYPPSRVDGKTIYYIPKDVLPAIYAKEDATLDDEFSQKARLDGLRADKVEMELQLLRGQVVKIEDVAAIYQEQCQIIRENALSLPTKMATDLALTFEPEDVQEKLQKAINELLSILSTPEEYSVSTEEEAD